MNSLSRFVRHASRVLSAALAALCVALPSLGGGGVTGTGHVAWGVVEDFGSVFVNGIEFFTTTANVVIDGVPGRSESELRIGMPVRVAGIVNADGKTGTASTVEYSADLRGTLDGPATATPDGAVFFVHGLAVRVDEFTVFDAVLGPGALAAGDRVEASGLRDAGTGELYATYVSRGALAAGTVVSGAISAVGASTFTLGSLTVAYDAASLLDAPPGGLANAMVVRVRADAAPVAGLLQAREVRVLTGSLAAAAGTEASAEGVVSGRTATGFSLGGLVVRIDGGTRYRDGTAADLRDGALVEAEGTVQADGSLVAARITFPSPDAASAEAVVVAKDATGFQLVSAEGVRVNVTTSTRYRDRTRARAGGFGWRELRVGDTVTASGLEVSEGTILAESVSRIDPTGVVVLRARARAVAEPAAVLLGMRTVSDATTIFRDASGQAIGAQAFFAKAVGRRVKAGGPVAGPDAIRANVMEIER